MSNNAWISISSVHNDKLKELRAVLKPSVGRRQGVFIVEGLRAVNEALTSQGFFFGAVIKRRDFNTEDLSDEAGKRLQSLLDKGLKAYSVTEECYETLTDTVSPQGIMLLLKRRTVSLKDQLEEILKNDPAPLVCVLASLRDPGNAGTIMRTADALDLDLLIATDDSVDLYAPKTVRAQMGSVFHIPSVQEGSFKDIAAALKQYGFRIFAGSGYGAQAITETDFSGPVALVIGNEANGLSDEEIAEADKSVFIPMPGKAESYNAAMAAGLMMYQAQLSRKKI